MDILATLFLYIFQLVFGNILSGFLGLLLGETAV